MSLYNIPVRTLAGEPGDLSPYRGKVLLVVNVASRCGRTPQYAALEELHRRYGPRGFTVLGFPCNQFGQQEPGTSEEIQEFCSTTYDVTFPLFEKVDVNGARRHPVYEILTAAHDGRGVGGDVEWNFEKFLVSADGTVVQRIGSRVKPDAPDVIARIEALLPA
ncbi:glutathione peroxidase [Streptomyces acidiscabies]|uniref:Glutathione peroxidase n=1 Tax=Streptomyces acidiscabies TaxID=42234 RepID=A0AAP6BF62_9ACTN|nr:glutathione peroxidase [Streptomyces acidiscabies]MBP5942025.1 glutathione peroxidase [Streptomyces sp. LBUM 1476]MBZ3913500.1 glutathione peroxidase [Streptomyces acidiscabies]MDX2963337.1 glutathione peroxidase [Streptomyces acidiscabies]MDX3023071.1 glutathione peroxidase [Streptomyces acidiscabies]MDX3792785.1 glutathione peroxidase [Streptomyces acidiscabies]